MTGIAYRCAKLVCLSALAVVVAVALLVVIVYAAVLGRAVAKAEFEPQAVQIEQGAGSRADRNLIEARKLECMARAGKACVDVGHYPNIVENEWRGLLTAAKNVLDEVLEASHLDKATAPMWGVYLLLVVFFAAGFVSIFYQRPKVVGYCAYALPFLGVAGTLLSFMIFAARRDMGVGGLKEAFLASLSYAAFTTIYGLISSLVLEAWLHLTNHQDV